MNNNESCQADWQHLTKSRAHAQALA